MIETVTAHFVRWLYAETMPSEMTEAFVPPTGSSIRRWALGVDGSFEILDPGDHASAKPADNKRIESTQRNFGCTFFAKVCLMSRLILLSAGLDSGEPKPAI